MACTGMHVALLYCSVMYDVMLYGKYFMITLFNNNTVHNVRELLYSLIEIIVTNT